MDGQNSKNLGIIIISIASIISLLLITLFIGVLFSLDLFESSRGSGGSGGSVAGGTRECGFTISKTSLSKSDYKTKIEEFAAINSNFEIFAENAEKIYELAVSKNVNPELVVIRAEVEGQGKVTGSNNYWGLGCTNESMGAGCYSWDSFEEGYTYFIDVVAKYDSLASMMQKYAYIGEYWFNLYRDRDGDGDTDEAWGDGGCIYANHIYPDGVPDRVKNACAQEPPLCEINGDTTNCTPTTPEDQQAYATWQVKTNMGTARKQIFGLEYTEGPCAGTTNGSLTLLTEYNMYHANLKKLNRTLTTDEKTELNNLINSEVAKAGYGTGAGVAAAGQSLVSGLEQMGYYLGYYWGGDRSSIGVGTNWGKNVGITKTDGGSATGPEWGMDCSGFVSWTIRNACDSSYSSIRARGFKNYGKKLNSLKEAKPGDLLVSSTHVILIIKNNGDGSIIGAEESLGNQGLIFKAYNSPGSYQIIDMSSWYNNNCNINA